MRILWIPHTGWHIPQRAHLFCRALAERHEVHVTDWVADFTSLSDYFSRRYLRNFTYRQYRDGQISVHGIPRVSPALPVRSLRRMNNALFSRYVRKIIDRYSIDVVVGTFVVPPPKAPRLVFDLFDDNVAYWRTFGRFAQYADEIEQTERAYLQTADAVVAASSLLVDQARQYRRNGIHYIPNGMDLRHFENANGGTLRAELGVQKLLVGVVGNHDKPAELHKILDAAKAMANEKVTFLIAGRGSAAPEAQKRVQQEKLCNVKFMGFIPFDKVPDIMSALDVGLCPYAKTPGADASSPMRLLMYTAAGVPVVCTDLASVRSLQLPNVVLVDDSSEALIDGIRKASNLPHQQPAQIKAFDLPHLLSQYEAVLRGTA